MLSLHARIFIAIALVAAIALLAVGVYSARTTMLAVERIDLDSASRVRAQPLVAQVQRYALTHPTLEGAGPFLHRLGESNSADMVLLNGRFQPIAASWGTLAPSDVSRLPPDGVRITRHRGGASDELLLQGGIPLHDAKGSTIARVFALPAPVAPPTATNIAGGFTRALWTAVLVALLAVVVIGVLLSAYIVGPLRELADATAAMARGDFKRRVRVRSSDDIGRLASSFNAMADAVERTETLRRQMVTDVAHELRSPLTRLRAQLESVQDGHIAPETVVKTLHDETLNLERLVDDLRDLSLADAHRLALDKRDIALSACIDEAINGISSTAQERGITVIRDIDANLPPLHADAARIRQILNNLLDNALRYTHSGGHVIVGAANGGRFIECFVQDDGSGIDPASLPAVFERFYRVDSSRSRITGGSGLGLAIVKELVEAHGGTITAESTPNEGSRFTFRIPL